jgi:hypothetical protein
VAELLGDDARRLAMGRKAAEFGRAMAWPVVAEGYLETFGRACRDRAGRIVPDPGSWRVAPLPLERP